MNTLIITYNIKNINVYDYDPVLYLTDNINSEIRSKLIGKHVGLIKDQNINIEIILQIQKYYKHFDRIILLDNMHKYDISEISISKDLPNNWIITGNLHREQWEKEKFIPSFYNINKLCFNCSEFDSSIFEHLKEVQIRNIYFPFFSRIKYTQYDKTFGKICSGITKIEKCENILL